MTLRGVIYVFLPAAAAVQLLPADPVGKAAARLIINRFGDKFVPAFYRLLVRQDPTEQSAAAAVLDAELSWLVQHIPQGPLAMSDQLTLVDCAVAPFLMRLYILEHYRYARRVNSCRW